MVLFDSLAVPGRIPKAHEQTGKRRPCPFVIFKLSEDQSSHYRLLNARFRTGNPIGHRNYSEKNVRAIHKGKI